MQRLPLVIATLALGLSLSAWLRPAVQVDATGSPASLEAPERLTEIERRLDELSDDVLTLLRTQRQEGQARTTQPQLGAKGEGLPTTPEETKPKDLDARLSALENQFRQRNEKGQWIASAEELGAMFKWSPETKAQATAWFNEAKDQALSVLSAPNEDGVSPLDQMADDFVAQIDFAEAMKRLDERMKQTVPGGDETYADQMKRLENRLFERFEGMLSDDEYQRFRDLNLAPTMIYTGYDPMQGHLQKVLERRAPEFAPTGSAPPP